ncbi:MAG: hypothetical protein RLZZ496_1975 [Pseudomonadota bacterium]|nr:DUF1178 family protein [Alphaproteobacteria bacterium]
MIKYQLHCDDGHDFEGWFPSSDAFEKQKKRGFVACAICGTNKVDRAIMAPAVARTDKVPADLPAEFMNDVSSSLISDEERELRQRLAELRAEMIKDAKDVGEDFAEEARKIHFGESDVKQIYGRTTLADARELLDEGIGVLPLPPSFDDAN